MVFILAARVRAGATGTGWAATTSPASTGGRARCRLHTTGWLCSNAQPTASMPRWLGRAPLWALRTPSLAVSSTRAGTIGMPTRSTRSASATRIAAVTSSQVAAVVAGRLSGTVGGVVGSGGAGGYQALE